MAHSSRGSSSSPAPSMSSSQPSTSIIIDDRMVKSLQYRRIEVVDGNCVRISETARRRSRRGIPSRRVPIQDTSLLPYRSDCIKVLRTRSALAKQSAIVHQSKSSPNEELLSRTRNDSFIDIPSAFNEDWCLPSREPTEVSNEYVEPLSPPPTPRFQRLPTPDLEPLKAGSFCDCWGCSTVSQHVNEHQGQVSNWYCPSS
jgi:hypothetical protein